MIPPDCKKLTKIDISYDIVVSLKHLYDCLKFIPEKENLDISIEVELEGNRIPASRILSYEFPKAARYIKFYNERAYYDI